MGKSKWILICGVLLLAFAVNATAAGRSDSQVFMQEDATSVYSATLATFVTSLTSGERTAISVSNTLAVPTEEGKVLAGFPDGLNTTGPVVVFCYNTLEGAGTPWVYDSSLDPVGTGLDASGNLVPGATWITYVDEILGSLGFDKTTDDFVGYCYFVGKFDAIVGTYINTLPGVSSQQAFPMQSDFAGVPIMVTEP
jgi:hypothetical protein